MEVIFWIIGIIIVFYIILLFDSYSIHKKIEEDEKKTKNRGIYYKNYGPIQTPPDFEKNKHLRIAEQRKNGVPEEHIEK